MSINDEVKKRLDKGVNVSFSIDIRKVENFFKSLFGKKDKEDKPKDDKRKKNKRRRS